jgi:hypothetical protein
MIFGQMTSNGIIDVLDAMQASIGEIAPDQSLRGRVAVAIYHHRQTYLIECIREHAIRVYGAWQWITDRSTRFLEVR